MIRKFFFEFLLKRYGMSVLKLGVARLVALAANQAGIHIDTNELTVAALGLVQGVYHWAEKKWPQLDPLHDSVPIS
jgi:hypothetical protein